jgi:hypothetical protein
MALGEMLNWDDPAIQETPPQEDLPHGPITFIRRAESSSTTLVFPNQLNAIDDRWKLAKDRRPDGPGASKTPQWRSGIGGKGNSGVAALISQTPEVFGYLVEYGPTEELFDRPREKLTQESPRRSLRLNGITGITRPKNAMRTDLLVCPHDLASASVVLFR